MSKESHANPVTGTPEIGLSANPSESGMKSLDENTVSTELQVTTTIDRGDIIYASGMRISEVILR
jgi:hypothetical protein